MGMNAKREALLNRTKTVGERKEKTYDGSGIFDFSKCSFDIVFFKMQAGSKNLIDLIPYIVSTNNHPDLEKGVYDLSIEFYIHKNIGIENKEVLCLQGTYKKKCPICEERQELIKDGWDKNIGQITALKTKWRTLFNVIDLNDAEHTKIKLFDVSWHLFQKHLNEAREVWDADGEIITYGDYEDGKSIGFWGKEERLFINGKNIEYLQAGNFRLKERKKQYKEDITKKAIPLDAILKVPTYEEVERMFLGQENEDEEVPFAEEETAVIEEVCPFKHNFGVDTDNQDECEECDQKVWEKCTETIKKQNRKKRL